MNVPRVLHIISAENVFGPEKTTLNECELLQAEGIICGIVNLWPRQVESLLRETAQRGISYHEIHAHSGLDRRALASLRAYVRQNKWDILHSHGYKADVYAWLVSKREGSTIVTTIHGWTTENIKVRVYESIAAHIWKHFDRVFCVSEDYRKKVRRYGLDAKKLILLRNGILLKELEIPGEAELRQRAATQEKFRVGIVGRLSKEKGHGDFLEIARILYPHDGPRISFSVIGDGPLRKDLEERASSLGLLGVVEFVGHLPDKEQIYESIDALAICSAREGLPNVLLEAMAYGRPVVSYAVGGVPEVIEDGKSGILVAPGEKEQFAKELYRLASNIELRVEIACHAAQRIWKDFSFEERTRKIEAYYRELCEMRK